MIEGEKALRLRADAVARAASMLPSGDPLAHLFYEEREDTRLRVSSDGLRDERRTRVRGAAAVGKITAQLSDPGPDDLTALARRASAESIGSAPVPGGSFDLQIPLEPPPGVEALHSWLSGQILPSAAQVEVRVAAHHQYIWVCRPGGKPRADQRRGIRIEVRATWSDGERQGSATEEATLRGAALPPGALISRAIERARHRALESRALSGVWADTPAVFAPGTAGIVVHELIGHALEGDVVVAGRSSLAAGNRRFPPVLNVVDDPRRARAPWVIDDEGTSAAAVTLVQDGVVAGMLHDRASAMARGVTSTGHGRRGSYLGAVLPRVGCTYIDSGTSDPGSIVMDTPRGIYIRRIEAGDAAPAFGTGTFVVTDGDRIEGGRLGPPLDPFPVFIDLGRHLASIDAVGDDLVFDRCIGTCVREGQPVAVSVGAPTIRLGVIKART